MRTETKRRVLLGMVFALVASAATHAQLMCYPPPAYEPVVFNDVLQPSWFPWTYGSLAGLANDPDNAGNKVLKVQYTRNWGEYIIFRPTSKVWETQGQVALVFRVRGIYNNCEKQVWVQLRDQYGQVYDSLPITEHMVIPPLQVTQECWGNTTTVGLYDPNKWYTVVIPITAFLNYSPSSPPNLVVKDIVFEGGWLANYGAGDLGTIYLDDIWWVQGLEFPLREGKNGNPAWRRTGYPDITSVFDHSQPGTAPIAHPFPTADNEVVAYTGEVGDGDGYHTDSTCRAATDGTPFDIDDQYRGANECGGQDYLSYNGHPGIDYRADIGTPIYAPGDGVITVSECEQASTGIPCSGGSGWGKLVIDLKGPYTVSFNHVSFVADGLGVDESEPSTSNRVVAGQLVGYSGDTTPPGYSTGPHVHMSVLLDDGEYVDPYGWTGAGDDPYRHRSVNVRLWKAQP